MFCNQCGTELAREAVFCHICGAPRIGVPQVPAEAHEPELPAPVAAPAVGVAVPSRPNDGIRGGIAAGAAIGAVLILIGAILPWYSLAPEGTVFEQNGFDFGYATDPGDGESGIDGALALVVSFIVIGLAMIYLYTGSGWASLGMIALGLAAGAVGGYDFLKVIDDAKETYRVSGNEALEFVGEGLYLMITGGIILAVTGFAGLGAAQAPRGRS